MRGASVRRRLDQCPCRGEELLATEQQWNGTNVNSPRGRSETEDAPHVYSEPPQVGRG
jgi:hypothetical protein